MQDTLQAGSGRPEPVGGNGPDGRRLPYQPPMLRAHGALHNVTSQMMISLQVVQVSSDVHAKENLAAVVWA